MHLHSLILKKTVSHCIQLTWHLPEQSWNERLVSRGFLRHVNIWDAIPPWNQNIWKFMVRKLYFLSFYYYPPQEKNNNNDFLREVLRLAWCFLDVSGEDKFHHPVETPSGGARRNSQDPTASTNGCLPWSVEQPGGWSPALVLSSNFWAKKWQEFLNLNCLEILGRIPLQKNVLGWQK